MESPGCQTLLKQSRNWFETSYFLLQKFILIPHFLINKGNAKIFREIMKAKFPGKFVSVNRCLRMFYVVFI